MLDALSDAETLERIETAVRRMPRRRRQIFLAARLDAMTNLEIAERTGLSVRQVEQNFAQALLAIADAIDGRVPLPWWQRWLWWMTGKHL